MLMYYVVELNVQIYGPGASSDLATEWESALDEHWNGGDPKYKERPVIFEINFVAEEPERSLLCQIVDGFLLPGILYPKKANYLNVVYVHEGAHGENHPFMRPYSDIEQSYDWGVWYSEMGDGLAFHESSHLMGIYANAPQKLNGRTKEAYAYWISGDLNGDSVDYPAPEEVKLIIENAIEREYYKETY